MVYTQKKIDFPVTNGHIILDFQYTRCSVAAMEYTTTTMNENKKNMLISPPLHKRNFSMHIGRRNFLSLFSELHTHTHTHNTGIFSLKVSTVHLEQI